MAIATFTEQDFASILHKGMMEDIRKQATSLIMKDLEKMVLEAVNQHVMNMKGYVSHHYDPKGFDPIFNVIIDGVKQDVQP